MCTHVLCVTYVCIYIYIHIYTCVHTFSDNTYIIYALVSLEENVFTFRHLKDVGTPCVSGVDLNVWKMQSSANLCGPYALRNPNSKAEKTEIKTELSGV